MGGSSLLLLLAAVGIGMWWFIARPQKRRQLELTQTIQNARPGTEIVTIGGIYGTVVENDPEETSIIIEIAEGVEMRVARRAIASVVPAEESATEDATEDVEAEAVEDEEQVDEPARNGSAG
jgi:preprotein translocase subunit YajC